MDQTSKAKGQEGRPPQAVLETDLEMLWEMYSTLSGESLRYLPIPFTRERIESWIESLDYDRVLPILAVVKEGDETESVVAGATLSFS